MAFACRYSDPDIVKKIIYKGGNINSGTNSGYTCIMLAASSGSTEKVKLLLVKNAITKFKATDDWDLFSLACKYGNAAMVQLLIDRGEKINKVRGKHGHGIRIAIKNGKYDIVKYLFEKGAKVYSYMINEAFMFGYDEIGKFFLDHGVELKERKGSAGLQYGTAKAYMYVAALNEQRGNNQTAIEDYQIAINHFEEAAHRLLKRSISYGRGRNGILLSLLQFGATLADRSQFEKTGVNSNYYSSMVPQGSGVIPPNKEKESLYKKKSENCKLFAKKCRDKINSLQ